MNYINIKGTRQKIRKEKYDFHYDMEDFQPYVTVCYLWMESGDIARGMSVCSYDDVWNGEEGKRLAKHFAVRALRGNNLEPVQMRQIITILIRTQCPFTKKGEKNPELSWWERRFLFNSKRMDKYESGEGYEVEIKPEASSVIGIVKDIDYDRGTVDLAFGGIHKVKLGDLVGYAKV